MIFAVPLARVLDPAELESGGGPSGYLVVDLPASWLGGGELVEVLVPPLVRCARCDGGGCDGCERSGAIRLASGDVEARTFRLHLPRGAVGDSRIVVRLAQPLGPSAGLDQLRLELRRGTRASEGCKRIVAASTARSWTVPIAIVVLAIVLGGIGVALATK